jgi:hypothetical protein
MTSWTPPLVTCGALLHPAVLAQPSREAHALAGAKVPMLAGTLATQAKGIPQLALGRSPGVLSRARVGDATRRWALWPVAGGLFGPGRRSPLGGNTEGLPACPGEVSWNG